VTGSGEGDRRYRVEHRAGDGVRVLARVAGVFPHWTTLIPYASRLLMDGATGHVVLRDEANGEIVATYALASGVRRRTSEPRPRRAETGVLAGRHERSSAGARYLLRRTRAIA
jgi:hypothetical protein